MTDSPDQTIAPTSQGRFSLFYRPSAKWLIPRRRRTTNIPPKSETNSMGTPMTQSSQSLSDMAITHDLSRLSLRVGINRARRLSDDKEDTTLNSYAMVSCAGQRQRTHVAKKCVDPEWQCVFDIPLERIAGAFNSQKHQRRRRRLWSLGLSVIVYEKDRFRSVLLGQLQLPFEQLFAEQQVVMYDNPANQPLWYSLQSPHPPQDHGRNPKRGRNYLTGRGRKPSRPEREPAKIESESEIEVKMGLVLQDLASNPAPDDETRLEELWKTFLLLASPNKDKNGSIKSTSSLPPSLQTPASRKLITRGRRFRRRRASTSGLPDPKQGVSQPRRFRRRRKDHIAKFHPDVVGVTFLEISHANNLPPERNMTRTGFDMDPFVVVSFGTSTFRTSSIRHNLNPVWQEKLFFHVRHNESAYQLKFAVYDKEKFTGNDLVGSVALPIMDIIRKSTEKKRPMSTTEMPDNSIHQDMDLHTLTLHMENEDKWKDRNATLTIRAKFVPYDEIRKMFWIALAKTYDVEGSGTMSRLEVQSMLETIGSTITEATLDSFWRKHGRDPTNEADELSIEDLVECFESHMLAANEHPSTAVEITPDTTEKESSEDNKEDDCFLSSYSDDDDDDDDIDDDDIDEGVEDMGQWMGRFSPEENQTDYATASSGSGSSSDDNDNEEVLLEARGVQFNGPEPVTFESIPLDSTFTKAAQDNAPKDEPKKLSISTETSLTRRSSSSSNEKVIRLSECPICHRSNLSKRAQMDIVAHVATCAANDWTTVDRFLMGNFLTEAYAQRRWFIKLVSKVGYGKYSLGTNNANIIVQDRRTGQLIEERMSVYIRLGMRLVYKGTNTGIQSKTAQRILTNMTLRQGRRFDAPISVREIPAFIKFHKIDISEVLHPLDSFKSFNEFFYRVLKPNSRPCDSPDDPDVAVSPADCRMMAFGTVDDATRLWIKGIEFSLSKLLDDPNAQTTFGGGSLAVFRLAPQDYHRFHCPVDGIVTSIRYVAGQYYTVNPIAVRTTLDVFGENARAIVSIDSERFGKVSVVCVGAMMVGSIIITAKVGMKLLRTDELGYFAFGGSTLVVIWQKDMIELDKDLINNSKNTMETLVRVGNHIGTRRPSATAQICQ
ncbi:phosphatidylserine decarboxylase-domain-containing protein [Phycomyces nitens]|nr:phosphatidylserine decarboxylase-domain-containing protein [Phycomyces nitens]